MISSCNQGVLNACLPHSIESKHIAFALTFVGYTDNFHTSWLTL